MDAYLFKRDYTNAQNGNPNACGHLDSLELFATKHRNAWESLEDSWDPKRLP